MAAAGQPLSARTPLAFADNHAISSWAVDGLERVVAAGIMQGVGSDLFNPQGTFTREQAITTLLTVYTLIN